MGSGSADGDGGLTNILYLRGRKRPYTLILNEALVAKWLFMGYIEPWYERGTPTEMAYKKAEAPSKILNRNERGTTV